MSRLLAVIALAGLLVACSKVNPLVDGAEPGDDAGGGGGGEKDAQDPSTDAPSEGPDGGSDARPPTADGGSDTPVEPPGVDLGDCELHEGTREQTSCRTALSCDGTGAMVSCHEFNERWRCLCASPGGVSELDVYGAGAEACDLVAPLCLAGSEARASQINCNEMLSIAEVGACSLQIECLHSTGLGAGVSVEHTEHRFVVCEDLGGAWHCECGNEERGSALEVPEGQAVPDLCSSVREVCDAAPLEGTGEAQCEMLFGAAEPAFCEAAFECAQEVEVGGRAASFTAMRLVNCWRTDSGAWECVCGGDPQAERLEIEGADGWEICNAAAATCMGGP